MKLKRKAVEGHIERQILIALITSRDFLVQALPMLQDIDMVEIPHFKIITNWCIKYFEKYGDAPGQNIQGIFENWESGLDEEQMDEADNIARLLETLDSEDDRTQINVPYVLDHLQAWVENRKLKQLQNQLDLALDSGQRDVAQDAVMRYRPTEIMAGAGFDPFRDDNCWRDAFMYANAPLIDFPGDAGRFLNDALTRDALIGIQGPEKRGKTFWCIEFVMRALMNRLHVAFFQVGDLSKHQVVYRLGMYLSQRPSRKNLCGTYEVPRKIIPPRQEGDDVEIETKERTFSKCATLASCRKAVKKFMRGHGMSEMKSHLKVSIHPNSSINVYGINSILDQWELLEDFVPDVIVIDYADILAPEDDTQDARNRVNDTWKALRKLSQERHCLVIAPTQADSKSYNAYTQTMSNFSEDKRKNAHVTGILCLNQTPQEKALGVMRLNWSALRESPFDERTCLWVGQCLPIGRAYYCASL
jgi:hypothetical protein